MGPLRLACLDWADPGPWTLGAGASSTFRSASAEPSVPSKLSGNAGLGIVHTACRYAIDVCTWCEGSGGRRASHCLLNKGK
jgi:hypothetical protein